jgi:uncharacterized protein YkwD
MKTVRTCLIIFALSIIAVTCKKDDEDFTQVSAFEKALHDEVNNYRATQGLNQLTLQFIMVKEAQAHARGRANGTISAADVQSDMMTRWNTVGSKLGVPNVSNEAYISTQITTQTAAEVVAAWAADSVGKIILDGDYTQSGPGTGTTSDGRTYIMHMFCKWTK